MEASYRVERRVGRLVEARVFRLMTREHTDTYGTAVLNGALSNPGPPLPVLCADHRPAAVYPPEAAERLIELFKPNNTRFERIAILVASNNATLAMQLGRLVREAGSERRRVFSEPLGAIKFLAETLEAAELERVREFLAEQPSRPA